MDLSEGMLEAAFERGELLASLFSLPRLINSVWRGGGSVPSTCSYLFKPDELCCETHVLLVAIRCAYIGAK